MVRAGDRAWGFRRGFFDTSPAPPAVDGTDRGIRSEVFGNSSIWVCCGSLHGWWRGTQYGRLICFCNEVKGAALFIRSVSVREIRELLGICEMFSLCAKTFWIFPRFRYARQREKELLDA